MKPLHIGPLTIDPPLLLAPMVDVTDLPYRLLCKEAGAGMTFTEMTHVEAIKNTNPRTEQKLQMLPLEHPIGIQITSRTLKGIREIIPWLKEQAYDVVDLNCGCPSHLTIDHGSGASLLKDPPKIGKMVRLLKDAGFIVTVKIRLGYSSNNALEIAKIVEAAGADALTVHARLATDKRHIPARWEEIRKIRQSVTIPVIGNGDVVDGSSAKRLLEYCDGVMIARAAIGDPLIFSRIAHYLETGEEIPFSEEENLRQFLHYLNLEERYGPAKLAQIKYLGGKFLKGIPHAASHRDLLMQKRTFVDVREFFKRLLESGK